MTVTPGQQGVASDFISVSTGAPNAGQIVKTGADGQIDRTFVSKYVKFGGTGADGALVITSGTTTINCAGAQLVVKNYSSISITGTGKLTFSNPHANGTVIVLKSQGDVTLTSSTAPMIDASAMGAAGGTAVSTSGNNNSEGNSGNNGISFGFLSPTYGGVQGRVNSAKSAQSASALTYPSSILSELLGKYPNIFVGAGGASGSARDTGTTTTSGVGGIGGGCLILECGGAFNFTTASGISVAGQIGGNASGAATSGSIATGGGGGGGGFCAVYYNTLTAASGTINVAGGVGGSVASTGGLGTNPSGGNGGNSYSTGGGVGQGTYSGGTGATGLSIMALNTEFA